MSLKKLFLLLTVLASAFLLNACNSTLGYSIVLWSDPEHNLQDGSVVRVYIKSNISHVYVISEIDSKQKFEIPVWQLTEPESRKKAIAAAKKYEEYSHTYASVKLDGLPIRAEAVNTSKQVYRLREKEIIRVLYKGNGQAVTNGNGNMSGDWLRVITSSGTEGWCFSHNLQLFAGDIYGKPVNQESNIVIEETDTLLEDILSKMWYPDFYSSMIRSNKIDPDRMKSEYGFDFGTESGEVAVNVPGILKTWAYSGITKKSDNEYKFNDIPVELVVKSDVSIVVQYTDKDGKPKSVPFISVAESVEELLQGEYDRREKELESLRAFGVLFESSNYGKLAFNEDNTFVWNGFNLLVPSIIAKGAKSNGTVSIKYFIADNLKSSYDGILTFNFNNTSGDVNFLYKMTENGLRLEDAANAVIKNNIVNARSSSPLVIFFSLDTGN